MRSKKQVMSVRPLSEFWKNPEALKDKINSKGGVRAKKYYMSALKQAYGGNLRRCQFCDERKVEVLTECSHFACLKCFHGGILCDLDHCDDEDYEVYVGWNANQQAHEDYTSRYFSRAQRQQNRTSPSKRSASPSAEERGRNKQPRTAASTTTAFAAATPINASAMNIPAQVVSVPVTDNIQPDLGTTAPTTSNAFAPVFSVPVMDNIQSAENDAILKEFSEPTSPTADIASFLEAIHLQDGSF